MARLTAPNGSTVHASDELAEYLLTAGYKAAEEAKPTAKRSAKSDSDK